MEQSTWKEGEQHEQTLQISNTEEKKISEIEITSESPTVSTTINSNQKEEKELNNNSVNNINYYYYYYDDGDDNELISFIQNNLELSFDEIAAKKLFDFYIIDDQEDKLEAPDIRKLLFDILKANKYPLIVPDEILHCAMRELCLNDNNKTSISWIEFKSYFVFLQEKPLLELFKISKRIYNNDDINKQYPRAIIVTSVNDDRETPSYDRVLFSQKIGEVVPDATSIFIYFLGSGKFLALVIGNFLSPLQNSQTREIIVDDITYVVEIKAFDTTNDIFPPIVRSGGIKSKVARKLAGAFVSAKQWDENKLNVALKTKRLVKKASQKWNVIDGKFKVHQKATRLTQGTINNVRRVDQKLQFTKRISNIVKTVDSKLSISHALQFTMNKLQNIPRIKNCIQKVEQFAKNTIYTVDNMQKETKQLIQEKQVDSPPDLAASDKEGAQNTNKFQITDYDDNEKDIE